MRQPSTTFFGTQRSYLFLAVIVFTLYFWLTIHTVSAKPIISAPDAPGSITGVVINEADEPLAGIAVSLYRGKEGGPLRTIITEGNGVYRFGLLPAGIYQLAFRDPTGQYAWQYYDDAIALVAATDVIVAGQAVTVETVSLAAGSQITGTITNLTASPIGPIIAFTKVDHQWQAVAETSTMEGDQHYTLAGLPAGVFRICTVLVRECYDNIASSLEQARAITLTVGQTVANIDFTLGDSADLGEIRGYVTSVDGTPLEGIRVTPYRKADDSASNVFSRGLDTQTNAAGYYRLTYLSPGLYKVAFDDNKNYLYGNQYYSQTESLEAAQSISVTLGSRLEGINATLLPGGHVVGHVRIAGELAEYARLWFYRQNTSSWQIQGNAWVDPSGAYTATGLATGVYRVEGEGQLNREEYRSYYGGPTLETARDIQVTAGATTTQEIDILVAADLFAGLITGTVSSDGKPLAGIKVEAIERYRPELMLYTYSDDQGRYQLAGLRNDSYYLRFLDPTYSYAYSWYTVNRPSRTDPPLVSDEATAVVIEGATVASDINVSLARAGSISGQAVWSEGAVASGIEVYAFAYYQYWHWISCPTANQCVPSAITDEQGNYQIQGLPTGRYRIGFYSSKYDDSAIKYYPSSRTVETAGDVAVQTGVTTTGIDVVLGPVVLGPVQQTFLPIIAR